MKDGKPETLEEALRLIEEQNRRLSEKENQLEQKSFQLEQKENQLSQKVKELDAANKEILKANKEILEKIAEIKLLNEKLAIKRARKWVARTEKMTKLLKDQPLLFDAEELGIKIENPCPSPSDEEISQAETDEDSSSEEKKTKKSGKGRKSVSTINNLAKARRARYKAVRNGKEELSFFWQRQGCREFMLPLFPDRDRKVQRQVSRGLPSLPVRKISLCRNRRRLGKTSPVEHRNHTVPVPW